MRYFDTSLIVAALTQEAATSRAQPLVGMDSDAPTFISDWTLTEFASALSIKLRTRQLTVDTRAATLTGSTAM